VIAELTVDLGALVRNVAAMRAVAGRAGYGAVVKANAYGHGLAETARALAPVVDTFCVYRPDEATALRDAAIATPILILGPVESHELDAVQAADAALALWSTGGFRRDAERAAARRGRRLRVHAKIDTGVARLGIPAAAAAAALAADLADPGIALEGVFTHLAAAEELASAFTALQLERFAAATAPHAAALVARGVLRHAAASAAAILYPESRLDLVRAGIATYGIWPSPATQLAAADSLVLEPALAWTTSLVVVRDVAAGEPVGYGCSYRTERDSRIGVLPIGYAEGLPRALGNAGNALVGGRSVPFVGRVCMNMAFLDVTDVPDAAPGGRVTLVGRDGDVAQDANELAAAAGTIGYELLARLPAGIPRRYARSAAAAATAASASLRSSVPS